MECFTLLDLVVLFIAVFHLGAVPAYLLGYYHGRKYHATAQSALRQTGS